MSSRGFLRLAAALALNLTALLVVIGPAPSLARRMRAHASATTVFTGRWLCDDRGAVFPLTGARVELWRGAYNTLWFFSNDQQVVDRSYTDAGGSFRLTAPRDKHDYFLRIVLVDQRDRVEVRDAAAPNPWFTDTATNYSDVALHDYHSILVSEGPDTTAKCAIWQRMKDARETAIATASTDDDVLKRLLNQEQRSQLADRKREATRKELDVLKKEAQTVTAHPLVVRANSPAAAAPLTLYDEVHWPPNYPTGAEPGGSEFATREIGHYRRYLADGDVDHFYNDAERFHYAAGVDPCHVTNKGFAFDDGWADYFARRYTRDGLGIPTSPCKKIAANNYSVAANVTTALAKLEEGCLKVRREDMIAVLLALPDSIHSYDDFRSRLSRTHDCGLKGAEERVLRGTGALPLYSPVARARSFSPTLANLDARLQTLDQQYKDAKLHAGSPPPPCTPSFCPEDVATRLLQRMAPALIQGQIRSLKVVRKSLRFEASSQGLKRLGSPFRKKYDRKLVALRRTLVKRVTAISAGALRKALKDAGAVVRADHSKEMRRAIRAARRALRKLRHGGRRGLPPGLWFAPLSPETVRSFDPSAPPPPPGPALTTIDFDDPALADQVLTNQYAARGVTFNYAEVYGQPGPGSANCGPPAVRVQAGSPTPPQVARLGNCPLDPMNPWYSGTFGAFGSPKTTVRAQVYMSTTCDGPCFAPVKLVAYNSLGAEVASGSANVPLGSWAPISASLPAGQPASISYFAIYREGSWQGTIAIDDLAFDAS